jgi:hypothetical protein
MDRTILTDSLNDYITWSENERVNYIDPLKPIVHILITRQELKTLEAPFIFNQIVQYTLPKLQNKLLLLIVYQLVLMQSTLIGMIILSGCK